MCTFLNSSLNQNGFSDGLERGRQKRQIEFSNNLVNLIDEKS